MIAVPVPPPPVQGYPLPASPPRYSFGAGTWGDILVFLGNHQHLMRSLGCERGDVLYYGPDPTIADWLRIQPMVGEVVAVRSPGPVSGIPTDPARMVEWWPDFAEHFKIRFGHRQVWPCHVDFTLRERLPVHRPELVTAPEVAEWARELLPTYQDGLTDEAEGHLNLQPWVLFQPRSETSCLWEGHWPYWHEAGCFLQDVHGGTNFFCGRGDFGGMFGVPEKMQNLVNQTPTMPHLFALADLCDVVVTTSNALSLYAAAKGLRTVVCCNQTHRRPEQFFTRFAKGTRSRVVEHWQDLAAFKGAWAEVMAL